MLNRFETAQQKWGGSSRYIDNWLQDRRYLIVSYCQLTSLPPFESKRTQEFPSPSDVMTFCQQLMDYLSSGHFEVYERITAQCDNAESKKLAERLTPKISASTDVAVDFNDKYAEIENEDWDTFDKDLSQLGQALVERFELEDQLIQNLYNQEKVTEES